MKQSDETKFKAVACSTSSTLLSDAKSTRLMQIRQKAMGQAAGLQLKGMSESIQSESIDGDLDEIAQRIDRYLHAILSQFPADKKYKFFKIRYGMTVEHLQKLPVIEILKLLSLRQND